MVTSGSEVWSSPVVGWGGPQEAAVRLRAWTQQPSRQREPDPERSGSQRARPKEAVVDASVAVTGWLREEYSTNAARLLDYDKRHAPAHWRAEVVDVLRAKAFRGA